MPINSEYFRNQKTYTTSEYLRDSFWIFDAFHQLLSRIKISLTKFSNYILRTDIETYILRIIENIPYMFLILYLGILSVFTLIIATEKENGIRLSTISTSSMAPSIRPGSMIISIPQKVYKKGDVISFYEVGSKNNQKTGRVLTHRIINVKYINNREISYVTRGDSNDFSDPGYTLNKNILGQVILTYPYLGYLEILIKTIPGFIVFVLLPVFILLRSEISYLKEEKFTLGSLKFGH